MKHTAAAAVEQRQWSDIKRCADPCLYVHNKLLSVIVQNVIRDSGAPSSGGQTTCLYTVDNKLLSVTVQNVIRDSGTLSSVGQTTVCMYTISFYE